MDGLAILQQNHTQSTVLHFSDARLYSNPSIQLNYFFQWVLTNSLNPFILNDSTVGRSRV
jgi:hypothetical protein